MYNLNYDFGPYNNTLSKYMEQLLNNTRINFHQQSLRGELINSEQELDALAGCIQNFEEYLYYSYQNYPNSFNHIINLIINNVGIISVLPKTNRGVFGLTDVQSKTIYINPKLSDSETLTGPERIRLYIAHELGHITNDSWMSQVKEYVNQHLRQGKLSLEQAQLIYDGFSLLDEATSQERAENFAYKLANKQRPQLLYYKNNKLFNSEPYKANFDFYGELEEPAIMFARTLRGIGKENDDIRALDMLSERAISPNFFTNILNEYIRDGQMPAFTKELQYMGLLKRASYANFNQENPSYLQNSKMYLEKFKEIVLQMRDYREPYDEDR